MEAVTAKMDVLGKTVLPRPNGFAGRQIRFAWTDQAKSIYLTQISGKKKNDNMFSYIDIKNNVINKHIIIEIRMIYIQLLGRFRFVTI